MPFLGTGMNTDIFQSCGHCWVFQICWHIECSTFTASSFRIWNSSIGILSPPLALLVVMLPKARLTPHSRMSGSRWIIIPLLLSGSWRSFLYSSSVYSCHLFLISSAFVRSKNTKCKNYLYLYMQNISFMYSSLGQQGDQSSQFYCVLFWVVSPKVRREKS